MADGDDTKRAHVTYRGNVQGVGFRWTVRSLAADLDVGGTVRNVPDGTVELDVQGPGDQVERLLANVREHFERNIEGEQVEWQEPGPQPDRLDIVR